MPVAASWRAAAAAAALGLVVATGGGRFPAQAIGLAEGRAAPARTAAPDATEPGILTPPAPREPRINGPSVFGVRPGRPFLYRIPATGDRPMLFLVRGLPAGLAADPATGVIRGTITDKTPRTYEITLVAKNGKGSAERAFRVVVGDTLALTPPMGWHDRYAVHERATDALVRQAADALVRSGLADRGYQYVNVDDGWTNEPAATDPDVSGPARGARGTLNPNRRFPDMKALAAYIHGLGLKAGLCASPGPRTCAGFYGSWRHEAEDAAAFAEWGFDFLKYDWCSYEEVAPTKGAASDADRNQAPYRLMGGLLAGQPRDIVFSISQPGMGDVWTWGGEVGGHSWRATAPRGLEKTRPLPAFYSLAFENAAHAEYAGPGRWNDPDDLLLGSVGHAPGAADRPTPTTLTPNEQYSYMSLWVLMAAPLFCTGDITRLDAFTLNVLANTEVIAVDQDALGRQGRVVRRTEHEFVLAKPMEDGSLAIGLFNLGESPRRLTVALSELGMDVPRRVRDLWRSKDIGTTGAIEAQVGRHGVALVRAWPVGAR